MTQRKGILVTGGAGYIGSHTVRQLGERGERIIVLDNLSTGSPEAVLCGRLVVGDAGDYDLVSRLLREHDIDTVLHFAAFTVVPESVANPLKYYANNTATTQRLLEACRDAGVERFVFSSSAAVYGTPPTTMVDENAPTVPLSPYGTSKLMSEWMLRDVAASGPLRYVALRYFNVAGCDPLGRIGQSTPEATLLIKVACQAAVGLRPFVEVYGSDYPTPDGTGVRDFIHVEDLAAAHLNAVDHLRAGGDSTVLNCGYGHGYSVREVLDAVARANGAPLQVREAPARPGDIAALVADAGRIRRLFNWVPRYDDLDAIVDSALAWERHSSGCTPDRPRAYGA